MPDDPNTSLIELTMSIHNQLNSIKNYKKNLAKRFEDMDVSSKKKGIIEEEPSSENKYLEYKAKYDELEESYQQQIKDTISNMRENKISFERKSSNLEEEITKKNAKIEELMNKITKHQEAINAMEARNQRLETMNNTLVNQLKDKTLELANAASSAEINLDKKKKEIQLMKDDFRKVLETIGSLEENVKTLKESKKKDNETIENFTKSIQGLQNENFVLVVENKKLQNQLSDISNQNENLNRWFAERKEKTIKFSNEIASHFSTIQYLNQAQSDFDSIIQPIKALNIKLMKEKESLLEENKKLKLSLEKDSSSMHIEEEEKKTTSQDSEKVITTDFYKDLFEKIANKENQIAHTQNFTKEKDREINKLKEKISELEEELEAARNSKKKAKKSNDLEAEIPIKKQVSRTEPKVLKVPEKKSEEILSDDKPAESEKSALNFLDDQGDTAEKDARLKINRKPKPVVTEKKESKPFGLFNAVVICAGCSFLVKKGEKSIPCTRCQSTMHDRCIKVLDDKNLCKACHKRLENEKAEKESTSKNSVNKTIEND